MQGAIIFAIDDKYKLAKMLGKEKEVAHWPAKAEQMRKAAMKNMYDARKGVFLSGKSGQESVLSQAWMVKAGVVKGKRAVSVLEKVLASPEALKPGAPYGVHYLIDAMITAGMDKEARRYLEDYWGGMVKKGAVTFWELYDPEDDFISAYRFSPLNSSCHAWSCTPVYFIHEYPSIFQR